MSKDHEAKRMRTRQLLDIAKRYYFNEESMVSISENTGISRFKVARLLREARESGIVSITLNAGGDEDASLSRALEHHMALDHALVIESYGSVEEVRQMVGAAAGARLSQTLRAGEVLGLAWGRTLTCMIESINHLPDVQILQLNGSVGSDLSQSPIELIRRASLLGGNRAMGVMAPLYVDSVEAALSLKRQPGLKEVFDSYSQLTTAVVSVGSFTANQEEINNSQFLPLLPAATQKELLDTGAVGEICGVPITIEGLPADPQLLEHLLAVTTQQLRRTPRVIAVASGVSKAETILAARRAGIISELVVDDALADTLLSYPPIKPSQAHR